MPFKLWLPPQYEQRYVAYFDVIGFKELVRSIESDATGGGAVFALLDTTFDELDQELRLSNATETLAADHAIYSSFSDNVAISTAATLGGLTSIITRVSTMAMRLMRRGIFVRGGIAKGPLFHSGSKLIGSAMIEAVDLESRLARYPRIVISDAVIADGSTLDPGLSQWWNEIQLPDYDGVWTLTPFYPYYASNDALNASGAQFADDHFNAVAGHMKPTLQLPSTDERRAKMMWLRRMLNDRLNYYAGGLIKNVMPI